MKILSYKQFDKGPRIAIFSIEIPKWGGFIINEISLFQKDNSKWISFPSKQYEKDGQKKYFPYNRFSDPKMSQAFQAEVLKVLEKYLAELPVTPLVNHNSYQNEEVPF